MVHSCRNNYSLTHSFSCGLEVSSFLFYLLYVIGQTTRGEIFSGYKQDIGLWVIPLYINELAYQPTVNSWLISRNLSSSKLMIIVLLVNGLYQMLWFSSPYGLAVHRNDYSVHTNCYNKVTATTNCYDKITVHAKFSRWFANKW